MLLKCTILHNKHKHTVFVKVWKLLFVLLTHSFLFTAWLFFFSPLNSTNCTKSHTSLDMTYELQLAHQHIPCQIKSASSGFSQTSCSIGKTPDPFLRDAAADLDFTESNCDGVNFSWRVNYACSVGSQLWIISGASCAQICHHLPCLQCNVKAKQEINRKWGQITVSVNI